VQSRVLAEKISSQRSAISIHRFIEFRQSFSQFKPFHQPNNPVSGEQAKCFEDRAPQVRNNGSPGRKPGGKDREQNEPQRGETDEVYASR
jgi:hypothetical protein